jgi:short-subunit dehydrogenase
MEGFSESISYELASQNIKEKLIEPGAINTDFGGRSMEFFFNDDLTDYKLFTSAFRAKLGEMEKHPAYASPSPLSPQFLALLQDHEVGTGTTPALQ